MGDFVAETNTCESLLWQPTPIGPAYSERLLSICEISALIVRSWPATA
jgi:hypothetical protein